MKGLFEARVNEQIIFSHRFSLMALNTGNSLNETKSFFLTPKDLDQISDGIPKKDFNGK